MAIQTLSQACNLLASSRRTVNRKGPDTARAEGGECSGQVGVAHHDCQNSRATSHARAGWRDVMSAMCGRRDGERPGCGTDGRVECGKGGLVAQHDALCPACRMWIFPEPDDPGIVTETGTTGPYAFSILRAGVA